MELYKPKESIIEKYVYDKNKKLSPQANHFKNFAVDRFKDV